MPGLCRLRKQVIGAKAGPWELRKKKDRTCVGKEGGAKAQAYSGERESVPWVLCPEGLYLLSHGGGLSATEWFGTPMPV